MSLCLGVGELEFSLPRSKVHSGALHMIALQLHVVKEGGLLTN